MVTPPRRLVGDRVSKERLTFGGRSIHGLLGGGTGTGGTVDKLFIVKTVESREFDEKYDDVNIVRVQL